MFGVVLEDSSAVFEDTIQILLDISIRRFRILCFVMLFVKRSERGILSADCFSVRISQDGRYLTGPEVDRSDRRGVNASDVQDQLAANIEPEVIVPGELEDYVVAPKK